MSRCYVFRAPDCDCVAACCAVAEEASDRKSIADFVASNLRDGMRMETLDAETVRTMPWGCQQHPNNVFMDRQRKKAKAQ